ncbi:hypothetical protein [Alteromonas macleodii]|uniref:Membrane protein n=1 Tax=Alteromonas macleodii TaxID=28108 RepID=A0AB36FNR4_ALTMA|nr:hypothetical protein [Alteromonas macleodii]OES24475.1 putative membrane protein [Alteromonas macleodii]OES25532.1 putative membrane protein [Alteromonas macleodii]OES25833.1 putative membrane protein [Alteromonas macleodii]OES38645.1 putative membrane protein [Alteromonas macleodii]
MKAFKKLCGFDKVTVVLGLPLALFGMYISYLMYISGSIPEAVFYLAASLLIVFGNARKLCKKGEAE